jgi:hypothetical protein
MKATQERRLPAAIAPALGLNPFTCPRCFACAATEGGCARCADLDYAGALELRLKAIALRMRAGRLAQVEALLAFCERTLP